MLRNQKCPILMSKLSYQYLPIPIITVAVILIAVAASITFIIILKFIWSRKNLANMQSDQNLCYAVNSQ